MGPECRTFIFSIIFTFICLCRPPPTERQIMGKIMAKIMGPRGGRTFIFSIIFTFVCFCRPVPPLLPDHRGAVGVAEIGQGQRQR